MVPTEIDPSLQEIQLRSLIGGVIIFFQVAGAVLGTCSTIEFLTNDKWNPCNEARKWILDHVGKKNGTYKYEVGREWVRRKIPGCEPMYSGTCNTGYYKYTKKV